MQVRTGLFILLVLAILSVAEFASIIIPISPEHAAPADKILFFTSLYTALTCVLSLILFTARTLRTRSKTRTPLFPSVRQSALLCLVITLSLFFSSLGIFRLWDIIPLLIAATLIEFFFQADKRPHATLRYERETIE